MFWKRKGRKLKLLVINRLLFRNKPMEAVTLNKESSKLREREEQKSKWESIFQIDIKL